MGLINRLAKLEAAQRQRGGWRVRWLEPGEVPMRGARVIRFPLDAAAALEAATRQQEGEVRP